MEDPYHWPGFSVWFLHFGWTIVKKMVESHLRWFEYVWRRPIETQVRRVDQKEVVQ